MHKLLKKLGIAFLSFSLAFSIQTFSPGSIRTVQAASNARIHYLTLPENTEAILLECNGKFGMVDSGEDTDYPSGSDSRYPDRAGTTKDFGYEDEVLSYLRSVGVNENNFEFYIGTHPHSDHIGTADEVIRAFHPKRVYIQEYKDSYISNSGNLWDNLYVYDHMLEAAEEVGATIIQNFKPGSPLYPETVSVSGSIIWDDSGNQDGSRPSQLDIVLTNTSTGTTTTQTVTPDDSGNWNYIFEGLQKYDDTKTPFSYTAALAETPAGYDVKQDSFQFICSHTPTVTDSIVSVIWDDGETDGSYRPKSLTAEIQEPITSEGDAEDITWETVQTLNLAPDDSGSWTTPLEALPGTDDNGRPIEYKWNITSESTDYSYSVSSENGNYTITAAYEGTESNAANGIQDEDSIEAENSNHSDNLATSSIPETDKVDPSVDADPTNVTDSSAASARIGQYDNLRETQNTTSTPDFTLGGEMEIHIVHYGGDYKTNPKPDANYFSLGVLVKANGKSAFLAGDINNYEGAETALANQLGHVDILTLGHHGYYGSNTYSYLTKLNPKIMVMAGNYQAVSNISMNNELGTLDTLLEMGKKGIPLYVTGLYHSSLDALVFNFDSSLSNNVPKNQAMICATTRTSPGEYIYYYNGIPTLHSGWVTSNGYTCYYDNSMHSSRNKWIKDSSGRYSYLDANGALAKGWVSYNGSWYYLDSSGYMKTGWLKENENWYYLDTNGAMVTGPRSINGSQYYFNANGSMLVSAWAEGKYYGSDGKYISNYHNSGWRKNNIGWWYQYPDGTYPSNKWETIDGARYYFNNAGYIVTGWLKLGNSWYYLNANGAMVTGWINLKNVWYYLDPSTGKMATGWVSSGGKRYYCNSNGAMLGQGWHWINGTCYYMTGSGAIATNTWIGGYYVDGTGAWIKDYSQANIARWIKSGSRWWYRHADGSYTRSDWEQIKGKWYYFDSAGWMKTGWLKLGNTWYYLSDNGDRYESSWRWINGKCYYFYSNGSMAANTWIDGYYVNSSGAWVKNYSNTAKWIKSGSRWWYRHADGSYTRSNWEEISGKWYYFDSAGWMKTGWLKLGNTWYYLSGSGDRYESGWHKISGKYYYFYSNGAMAANTRIGSYYVDASGAWIPGR